MMEQTTATQRANRRIALILVCTASFVTPLMLSGVNVAIPAIADSLDADAVMLSWIPTAYLLATAVFLLPCGKLGDLFGRKRVFIIGLGVMGLGSLLAATAVDINLLIAWRVIQGLGSAMISTSGIPMMVSIFPPHRRGSVVGMTTACVYMGLTGGPLIGGLCTDYLSWRAIFIIHAPVMLVLIVLCLHRLRGEWAGDPHQSVDYRGAVLFGAGISALVYGLSLLPAPDSVWLIAAGLTLLVLFTRYERRIEHPILDMRLFFENRLFLFSTSAGLFLYSASFSISYLMSLYLQYIQGLEAQAAGALLIVQPLMMAALSPLTGRLSDRVEPRVLASSGLLLNITGYGLLALCDMDTSLGYIIACLLITGTGFALFSPPNINAILGSVRPDQLGSATGITSTVRVMGQMFSMAIVTLIFALNMGNVRITPELYPLLLNNVNVCLAISAGLACLAMLCSFLRGNLH